MLASNRRIALRIDRQTEKTDRESGWQVQPQQGNRWGWVNSVFLHVRPTVAHLGLKCNNVCLVWWFEEPSIHHRKGSRQAFHDQMTGLLLLYSTAVQAQMLNWTLYLPIHGPQMSCQVCTNWWICSKEIERKGRTTHTRKRPFQTEKSSTFVPLIFEHFGQAENYLHKLSTRSTDEDGHSKARAYKGFWRKCVASQLQKCKCKSDH